MRYFLPLCFLGLTACISTTQTRGYVQDPEWKDKITVGVTTQQDVQQLLGSPSTVASFGPEEWYYVSTTREKTAFFQPEVVHREIVRIAFNEDGTVAAVDQKNGEEARDITTASRTTPTEGHSMTFMEQLFGNMGRFNAPGRQPGAAARGTGGVVSR